MTDDQLSSTNISAKSTPPISPPSHHRDKHFFDVNLVEMKSQASSTSTLDYDSMDEVWVKRYDPETSKRRAVWIILRIFTIKVTIKNLSF